METKLWKEMLFLLIPFVLFIAVSLMAACSRIPTEDGSRQTPNLAHSREDPFSDLSLSQEERSVLRKERAILQKARSL